MSSWASFLSFSCKNNIWKKKMKFMEIGMSIQRRSAICWRFIIWLKFMKTILTKNSMAKLNLVCVLVFIGGCITNYRIIWQLFCFQASTDCTLATCQRRSWYVANDWLRHVNKIMIFIFKVFFCVCACCYARWAIVDTETSKMFVQLLNGLWCPVAVKMLQTIFFLHSFCGISRSIENEKQFYSINRLWLREL